MTFYCFVIYFFPAREARVLNFLTGSTIPTTETVKYTDGKEYPLYMVETSSTSHPFYTGQEKALDTAGRAEKFKSRASKAGKK
jgi:large subunit ribosomal protein L31